MCFAYPRLVQHEDVGIGDVHKEVIVETALFLPTVLHQVFHAAAELRDAFRLCSESHKDNKFVIHDWCGLHGDRVRPERIGAARCMQ